jgi:hypothetical protein
LGFTTQWMSNLKLDGVVHVRELRHLDSARFNPYDLLHPTSRANRRILSQVAT